MVATTHGTEVWWVPIASPSKDVQETKEESCGKALPQKCVKAYTSNQVCIEVIISILGPEYTKVTVGPVSSVAGGCMEYAGRTWTMRCMDEDTTKVFTEITDDADISFSIEGLWSEVVERMYPRYRSI